MTLNCESDKVISVVNAKYGKWISSICPSLSNSNELCYGIDVTGVIKNHCDNNRRCQLPASSELLGQTCPDLKKYLEVKYRCVSRPRMSNPCANNPCGFGAICRNIGGFPVCSCPTGSNGDPKVRCCKSMHCL